MRIAMVSEHASPLAAIRGADAGGQNVHVSALARELARSGNEVEVFTRRDDAYAPDAVKVDGYIVRHVEAGPPRQIPKDDIWPHIPAFGDELRRHWEARPPQLVHSHFWMSGVAAAQAIDACGAAMVHTYHALGAVKRRHQGPSDPSPEERVRVERFVGDFADRIIATCSDEVFELRRMGISTQATVVPCGVDIDAFAPEFDLRPRADQPFTLVCAGRPVERKGVDLVIGALPATQARLIVVGAGAPPGGGEDPDIGRLRDVAREAGVEDRVTFVGALAREHMPAAINSADAVICTPWYEPFGIVPLEAGACAVPVIAAAVGGLADTVVHEQTGLLVPPRDTQAIAAAINRLDQNRTFARDLGSAAADRIRSRYSWRRVAETTLAAYREIVRTPHRHAREHHTWAEAR